MYFNFIMILFYWVDYPYRSVGLTTFQFHYDLILFVYVIIEAITEFIFQFHYDLILLSVFVLPTVSAVLFQFHYDLILLINMRKYYILC